MKYNQSEFQGLYNFLWRVAEILAPAHTEDLFDYLIHAMDDDGGFLRSRYCYWEEPVLRDCKRNYDWNVVLLTAGDGFDFENPESYYEDRFVTYDIIERETRLKFQLFFGDYTDEKALASEAEWARELGYGHAIRIDMRKKEYSYLEHIS